MFAFDSIERYHADLKEGKTTCLETVRHYLAAIEKNQSLNAFIEVFGEEAIKKAKELDAGPLRGRLHGVIIGLKDNICYRGHRSGAASLILENFISPYSATAVERLLHEGAIIIGRQNCDEFGMGSTNENSPFGPVHNPVHYDYVPGGSSGGGAASVKAGLCMAALGSDTGGSVRQPADFCGVVGLKPGYGRVSRHGLIAYGSSFDQIGILTQNIPDAERILQVISGPDEFDSTALPEKLEEAPVEKNKKFRIAWFPEWIEHPSVDPEISASLKKYISQLSDAGHQTEPVHFSLTDYIVPTYYVLTTAEASSNLSRFDGIRYGRASASRSTDLASFYQYNRSEGFGREVKRRIMLGTFVLSSGYYDAYFTKAQQVRQQLKSKTELIFKDFDFILAPNSPTTAYKIGEKDKDPLAMYLGDIFTVFASLTALPAISLPVFKHSSNLPFGVQLIGSPQDEVSLLRFSHHLMQQ
ncbi:MAG: Asp-tRNA(Asn)/Glu-tRNA(Gln) amidotransferase subunit GatA [Flavisolibacter sp.]